MCNKHNYSAIPEPVSTSKSQKLILGNSNKKTARNWKKKSAFKKLQNGYKDFHSHFAQFYEPVFI